MVESDQRKRSFVERIGDDSKPLRPADISRLPPHLRIEQVLQLYPVSEESWLIGVAEGRYPKPQKIGPLEMWRKADVKALCDWYAGKFPNYPNFPVEDDDTGELPLLDSEFDS